MFDFDTCIGGVDTLLSQQTILNFVRWTGAISVIPAIVLPFYNQFLHGGRDAASIVPRSGFYAEIHVVAAICSLFVIFGLISIYLKISDRAGRAGLWAFFIATVAQGMYAGELFIDGFFNPMLSRYDPVLQTHFHSAQYLSTPMGVLGGAFFFVPFVTLSMFIGYGWFGYTVVRSGVLPRSVGVFLGLAGMLLGSAIFELQWIETLGYLALASAIAWAALVPVADDQATESTMTI